MDHFFLHLPFVFSSAGKHLFASWTWKGHLSHLQQFFAILFGAEL
jgi:hypothetical protein